MYNSRLENKEYVGSHELVVERHMVNRNTQLRTDMGITVKEYTKQKIKYSK